MTGSIKDYTPNYNLIIPEFNITGWHDYLEANFRSIDAMFYNLFAINNYKGEWTNSTIYNVGDTLFIGKDRGSEYEGRLVKVKVRHTTRATGTFSDELTAHPTYYDLYVDASAATEAADLAYQYLSQIETISVDCITYRNDAKTWAEGTDEEVQALGGTHSAKNWATGINLTIGDLGGTNIVDPQDGEFLMYNDGKWVNTESSASIAWGGIIGDIDNQTDLINILNTFIDKSSEQNITNIKYFSTSYQTTIYQKNTSIDITDITKYGKNFIEFIDKNSESIASVGAEFTSDGYRGAFISPYSTTLGYQARLGVYIDDNTNNVYTYAPTPTEDTTNSHQIDTVGARNTQMRSYIKNILASLYPVGSIYIGTQSTCPLASLISGSTWTKISGNKVLQSSSSSHAANTTIDAGLPNITGSIDNIDVDMTCSGAFYQSSPGSGWNPDGSSNSERRKANFNASRSSSIYGNSTTVQPPAYVVHVWRRTA